MPKESKDIETMVDLLRQGATLTERSCPSCSSPIFKLRSNNLWCARCQKRVIIVKEGNFLKEAISPMLLKSLESTVLTKLQEIEKEIRGEKNTENLQRLGSILFTLLESLETIRRIKKT